MSALLRPLSLSLYAAALGLLEPLAAPILRRRAVRGKEDPARLGERLGRGSVARPPGPLVWLHGVSVGESVSLLPLAQALRERRPDIALLVTSGTRTAAELLAKRLPPGAIHQYAPVDAPGAVARFLDHWRPDAAIQVESELWPNLILGAKARGVRLALVSARMTQKSADGWARAPAAARTLLTAFDLVLPQDAATAERLTRLGAAVGPRLNLKLVGAPLTCDPDELDRLQAAVGSRKVVLAANTHPGEDEIVLAAYRAITAEASPTLLIVVPRHPVRGEAVADLLQAAGLDTARRSLGEPLTPQTEAYVADTLGEMGLFYRLADIVVMGGAFRPDIGGHNPLEAARLGAPVLSGPHAFNSADVYCEMVSRVAVLQAADDADLARDLAGLIAYPNIARRIGEAAQAYAQAQGSALDEALARLQPLLPA